MKSGKYIWKLVILFLLSSCEYDNKTTVKYEVIYIETGEITTVEGIPGYNKGDHTRDDQGEELEILRIKR